MVFDRFLKSLRYFGKFAFLVLSVGVETLICVPFMLHRPRDCRNCLIPCWACRLTSRLFLGVTFEVRGHENIVPEGQGCVVAINHQSALDVLVLTYIWPYIPKAYCIVKRDVFWLFPFGPAAWLWGTVYIDRKNAEKSKSTVNTIGNYITSEKARLCIFPEGTRHSGATLLPFKKGAFHVALAAQCAIQPVVVSKYHFLDHQEKRFDSGRAVIEFLPIIPVTKSTTLDGLIQETHDVMQDAFTRLSQETRLAPHQVQLMSHL